MIIRAHNICMSLENFSVISLGIQWDIVYMYTHTCICIYIHIYVYMWLPGPEDPLKKEVASHSSIPACEILWTEEPGGWAAVLGVTKSLIHLSNQRKQQHILIYMPRDRQKDRETETDKDRLRTGL